MKDVTKNLSRFLSLILRHKPESINIKLDKNGWADVTEILRGMKIDMATLEKVVAENDKQRFSFSEDKTKIRANSQERREAALTSTYRGRSSVPRFI